MHYDKCDTRPVCVYQDSFYSDIHILNVCVLCVSLVAALQLFHHAPTVQYKSCAALELTRDAWKYFKMALFPFHI